MQGGHHLFTHEEEDTSDVALVTKFEKEIENETLFSEVIVLRAHGRFVKVRREKIQKDMVFIICLIFIKAKKLTNILRFWS